MAQLTVTKTVLDAGTFEDITLVKVVEFSEAGSVADALAVLGNDNSALLAIINSGLAEKARSDARSNGTPWHSFKTDESGEPTSEINGVFTGKVLEGAGKDQLNSMVLTMAKAPNGGWPEKGAKNSADLKAKARAAALEKIKANAGVIEFLSSL